MAQKQSPLVKVSLDFLHQHYKDFSVPQGTPLLEALEMNGVTMEQIMERSLIVFMGGEKVSFYQSLDEDTNLILMPTQGVKHRELGKDEVVERLNEIRAQLVEIRGKLNQVDQLRRDLNYVFRVLREVSRLKRAESDTKGTEINHEQKA